MSPCGIIPALHVILLEHASAVDQGEGQDGAEGGPGLREGPVVKEAGLAPAAAPAGDGHLHVGHDAHIQNPAEHLEGVTLFELDCSSKSWICQKQTGVQLSKVSKFGAVGIPFTSSAQSPVKIISD